MGFRAEPAWAALGFFGWMLMAVGAVELVMTVIPPERSPEWEFATAIPLVSGLPVPVMGLVLVLASALKRRARVTARVAATIALVGAVMIGLGLIVFALTIPVALRFMTDSLVRLGIMKAIVKTLAQGSVYMVGLAVLGFQGWQRAKSGSRSDESREDT